MNAKTENANVEAPKDAKAEKPVDMRKLTISGCKEFKGRVEHTQDQYAQMCAAIKAGKTYAEIAHKHDYITAGDGGKFVGYALKQGWVNWAK